MEEDYDEYENEESEDEDEIDFLEDEWQLRMVNLEMLMMLWMH